MEKSGSGLVARIHVFTSGRNNFFPCAALLESRPSVTKGLHSDVLEKKM